MSITATLFGQIITFAILVWFINKTLWGPMTAMLESRKEKIADGLAAAERGQKEHELAEKDAIKHIKEGKEQAAQIIALAQKRSLEIIDDAKVDAQLEGQRIIKAAEAELAQEAERVKEALRGKVVDITIAAASKIINKEINAKTHGDILKDVVGQI
ncbi:MAG: F0F1 ATP synthase subunit B [Pseudomonadota bacterium]